MATAAAAGVASLRYFPSSLRYRGYPGPASGGGLVTFSPRRGRYASAAAVAAPASSLGDLTRVDFPILDQVSLPPISVSSPSLVRLGEFVGSLPLLVPSGTNLNLIGNEYYWQLI